MRPRLLVALLTLLSGGLAAPMVSFAQADSTVATPVANVAAVLDGTAPIDAQALADLARERVILGTTWLTGVVQENGMFHYIYDPATDQYVDDSYNEVRHAGTLYALYQAYGAFPDDTILVGAERAVGFIDTQSMAVEGAGRAYVDPLDGRTSLGGQALAIVAMLERRRVTAAADHDDLIDDLARFMLSMEMPNDPGHFFSTYDYQTKDRLERPTSAFYPGETLLALTRLAQQFPDGPYLDAAKREAGYQIHRADGDLPKLGTVPRDDHWLTIALGELYRLDPNPDYLTVAYLEADRMIANQYTADDGYPVRIGGAKRDGPIGYTSTATKGEALVAAWAAAAYAGDQASVDRISLAARRNAQFQLRVQYIPENSGLMPRPDRVIGGWAAGPVDPSIRIDYVQHNISALINVWLLTKNGDLSIAKAMASTSSLGDTAKGSVPEIAIGFGVAAFVIGGVVLYDRRRGRGTGRQAVRGGSRKIALAGGPAIPAADSGQVATVTQQSPPKTSGKSHYRRKRRH